MSTPLSSLTPQQFKPYPNQSPYGPSTPGAGPTSNGSNSGYPVVATNASPYKQKPMNMPVNSAPSYTPQGSKAYPPSSYPSYQQPQGAPPTPYPERPYNDSYREPYPPGSSPRGSRLDPELEDAVANFLERHPGARDNFEDTMNTLGSSKGLKEALGEGPALDLRNKLEDSRLFRAVKKPLSWSLRISSRVVPGKGKDSLGEDMRVVANWIKEKPSESSYSSGDSFSGSRSSRYDDDYDSPRRDRYDNDRRDRYDDYGRNNQNSFSSSNNDRYDRPPRRDNRPDDSYGNNSRDSFNQPSQSDRYNSNRSNNDGRYPSSSSPNNSYSESGNQSGSPSRPDTSPDGNTGYPPPNNNDSYRDQSNSVGERYNNPDHPSDRPGDSQYPRDNRDNERYRNDSPSYSDRPDSRREPEDRRPDSSRYPDEDPARYRDDYRDKPEDRNRDRNEESSAFDTGLSKLRDFRDNMRDRRRDDNFEA